MDPIILFENKNISDELATIQKRALNLVKLGLYKAAAHIEQPNNYKLPADPASLEQRSLSLLTEMNKKNGKKAKDIRKKALIFMGRSDQFKSTVIGDLSKIKAASSLSVVEDAKQLGLLSDIKFGKPVKDFLVANKTALKPNFHSDLLTHLGIHFNPVTNTGAQPINGHSELRFNLVSLKCLDPQDWEITDFGKDHINMGGMGLDSLNQQITVNQFFVDEFTVNKTHTYHPVKKFVGFKLNTPGAWPRAYDVTMALAEKDADGGFLAFLKEIWGIAGDIVKQLITAAVITAAGAIAGTAIEPGVGTIIGAIVGAVIGYIVTVIFDSLKDDLFDPESQSILLPAIDSLFPGNSKVSGIRSTEFTSSNARYFLRYQWELV